MKSILFDFNTSLFQVSSVINMHIYVLYGIL